MSWIVRDGYMSKRIIETESMLKLKEFIKENDIKCDVIVEHCDRNFWFTKEEKSKQSNIVTGYTYLGCDSTMLPPADEKDVCIKIKLTEKENCIEKKDLDLTINNVGETLNPWSKSKIYQKVSYMLGVYKRKGFDMAFKRIKESNQYITEKKFASTGFYDWNNDLVEVRLHDGEENCIDVIERHVDIETDKSYSTLTLLSIDIEKNLPFIKEWLLSCK